MITTEPGACTYSWKVDSRGVLYDRRMAELTFADLEALPRDADALFERFKAPGGKGGTGRRMTRTGPSMRFRC
ncbi:hypothetical protein FHR32_003241 [Streptosporangium album]|uniref:Uncharacterized protein n=1 Tax=Streptosporangium album TaxID=47479 RepID=A0A7W7RWY9_9ACTN|nr:hypothetical protein [Streptosporangium album]